MEYQRKGNNLFTISEMKMKMAINPHSNLYRIVENCFEKYF